MEPLLPLQLELDDVVPEDAQGEAGEELQAAIIQEHEEEDREHDCIGGREARQDVLRGLDAGIARQAPEAEVAYQKGDEGADHRRLKTDQIIVVLGQLETHRPRHQHRQHDATAKLKSHSVK